MGRRKTSKFVYWTPRIAAIALLLFLTLFSLDVITPESGVGDIAIGLFIHNIPVIILLVLLIIAWNHELVGAVTFVLAGFAYMILSAIGTWPRWYLALSWSLIIAGPAFFIGILFLINWLKKQK